MELHGKWDESFTKDQETYGDELHSTHATPGDHYQAPEVKDYERVEKDGLSYATHEVQRRPSTCSTY